MDEWDSLIEGYQDSDDPKVFSKVLKSAENVLAEDLATFEIEWILTTLLQKPVKLLEKVTDKRLKDGWSKCITSSLKLLTDVVSKYEIATKFYKEIVEVCLLPWDPGTRQLALACLRSVAPRSALAARNFDQHLIALEMATTNKAPLALLVGAICEHHPEIVENEFINIWRVFLNLLDSNKHTGTVINAILQGVMGLFKHFGFDLPTMELDIFYDKFVKCFDLPRCEKTCVSLVQRCAGLFRERLAGDVRVRSRCVRSRAALRALCGRRPASASQKIQMELLPLTKSNNYYEKFTALYILADYGDMSEHVDIQALEFDIRNGNVDYETCEALQWCVSTKILFSDRLLQAAILFCEAFAAIKRTDAIINSILCADDDVRSSAVIYLLKEASRSEQHQQLWCELFKSSDVSHIVDDVTDYAVGMVESCGSQELAACASAPLAPLALLALPAPARAALLRASACANISINDCTNDYDRLQRALAVIEMDDVTHADSEIIMASEIIFTSKNIDTAILCKALKKLEKAVYNNISTNDTQLNDLFRKIILLSTKIDKRQKNDRILYREIIIFLGKCGVNDNSTEDANNGLIATLKNKVNLELPYQNTTVKIDLRGALQAALQLEDVEALTLLRAVLCAALSRHEEPALRSALLRVCARLARCGARLPAAAAAEPARARRLVKYITKETSSRSRALLLEALEVLLKNEAEVLQDVVESFMLYDDESNTHATLDVLYKLLQLIKENNLACKQHLPGLVLKTIKTQNSNLIRIATEVFVEKIGLYEKDVISKLKDDVMKILLGRRNDLSSTTAVVEFLKRVIGIKNENCDINDYVKDSDLTILIAYKQIYKLDSEKCKSLMSNEEFLKRLFVLKHFDEDDVIFDFLTEFREVLVQLDSYRTCELLERVIISLTPERIVLCNKNLTKCLKSLRNTTVYKDVIDDNLKILLSTIPLHEITESVEKYNFVKQHEILMRALNIILKTNDSPIMMERSDCTRRWIAEVLRWLGNVESLETKRAFMNDLVEVSLVFLSDDERLSIIKGPSGIKFYTYFIPVTFQYLKNTTLLSAGLNLCPSLLNVIVKYAVRRRRGEEILEIVDQQWPSYETKASFNEKYALLQDILTFKMQSNSNPMKWVIKTFENGDLVDKTKMMMFLPDGYDFRDQLPPLPPLRHVRGVTSCYLRAILDRLASGDLALMDFISKIADDDSAKGWWDDAIDMCMCSLGRAPSRVDTCLRRGGTCRVIVPLLRYTEVSQFEEYVSSILRDQLSCLKLFPREIINHHSYETCLLSYIKALKIILLIFEKVPKDHIESRNSVLYSKMAQEVGSSACYLITAACKLCFTLKDKIVLPHGAGHEMRRIYTEFHCLNYKCFATAVLMRAPRPEIYSKLFELRDWDRLIDDDVIYLPIVESWKRSTTRSVAPHDSDVPLTASGSIRTKMFTRTLSEDPVLYDLYQEEQQFELRELRLPDNPLNRHPCAASLSELLGAAAGAGAGAGALLPGVLRGLREGRRNVQWLLAQAICNRRESWHARAGALQPALLQLVGSADDKLLNSLHLDVIDSIILWDVDINSNIEAVIECIMKTAISNRHRANVCWSLVDRLVKLLAMCKNGPPTWTFISEYINDLNSDKLKVSLQIMKRLARNNVYVPVLLPMLMENIEKKRLTPDLTELFGLVLNLCEDKEAYVSRLNNVLAKLRASEAAEYINLLYYVTKGCPHCCNDNNFRIITDLTPKILGREKLKCLDILSRYAQTDRRREAVASMIETVALQEHLQTSEGLKLLKTSLHLMSEDIMKSYVTQIIDVCQQLDVKKRRLAYEVLLKALELKLTSSKPQSKRRALESNSLILNDKDEYTLRLLRAIAQGVVEGAEIRNELGSLLDKDLCTRFWECYYIFMVLAKQTKPEVNLSAILDLFFQCLRDDRLKNTKLKDEPITTIELQSSSHSNLSRPNHLLNASETSKGINVQITLDEIVESLIKFCEKNAKTSYTILIQLIKAYRKERPGFDVRAMGASVIETLNSATSNWPAVLAREVGVWEADGLKDAIENLHNKTKHTDAEDVTKLLYQDYRLRCFGPEQFVLGSHSGNDGGEARICTKFSMKDLISAFGELSDWDSLTIQQKTRIENSLPPLWTNTDEFKSCVDMCDYDDGPLWLKCMVTSYRDNIDNYYSILKDVAKWPRKIFDLSAVCETMSWQDLKAGVNVEDVGFLSDVRREDCLAQGAARAMMRRVLAGAVAPSRSLLAGAVAPSRSLLAGAVAPSRSLLAWAARASETALHRQVLRCCESVSGLCESETLKWLRFKVLALRAIGLQENDSEGLRGALQLAESYTVKFVDQASLEDIVGMKEVIIRLKSDLKVLKQDDIRSITRWIKTSQEQSKFVCNGKLLESLLLKVLTFCDNSLDSGSDYLKEELLDEMSKALKLIVDFNLPSKLLAADVIINRLDQIDYLRKSEEILNSLQQIIHEMDAISLDRFKDKLTLFRNYNNEVIMKYVKEGDDIKQLKSCLTLVGDAAYLLLQYCDQLDQCQDKDEWTRIFEKMKQTIFEEPRAGPDRAALRSHRAALYRIEHFDATDRQTKAAALQRTRAALGRRDRQFVSLSHVCPALKNENNENLSKLLNLKTGVSVYRFEEKIKIFTDSIRRPALLSVRLSDGTVSRYIIKRGEGVRSHVGAMRFLTTALKGKGYNVTELSDDCALLQQLRRHERLRSLLPRAAAAVLSTVSRAKDSELILAADDSLKSYEALCSKVPAYVLRSAIEDNSISFEDFINKKRNFEKSLCEMTLFSYLCGITDRHLENIMYDTRSGGIQHVDCGAAPRRAAPRRAAPEPPARLSRAVLAVCDAVVLESRLQNAMSELREAADILLPSISLCYKWMGDECMDELPYIRSLIQGAALSHTVAAEVISKSAQIHKEKYLQLIEEIFTDFVKKDSYTVEEQITSLLRHCTEPRILSITRSGWEPWI